MPRKSGLEIKKKILKEIEQDEISLRKLETKLNTNNTTIKRHVGELEYLGLVKTKTYEVNERNGRPYTVVKKK